MRPAFVTLLALAAAGLVAAGSVTAVAAHRSAGAQPAARPPAGTAVVDALAAPAGTGGLDAAALVARGAAVRLQQYYRLPDSQHAFYFTRAIYSSQGRGWRRGRGDWATDFPKADLQFLVVLRRLARIDAYDQENAIRLDDPEVRRFPFLYMLEVGDMALTPPEQQGLRDYLLAGGFLVIDDFWGSREWANFQYEIQRVLPEYPMVELDLDHPIFSAYYQIDEILQVPAISNIQRGRTSEADGYVPHVLGIHDDRGRLMVLINWNTDLGDAWEWAEQPTYPLKYSTFAFQIAVNFIIYAMSH